MPIFAELTLLTQIGPRGTIAIPLLPPWSIPGPNIEPMDEWFSAVENLANFGDANSINIPWLLAISLSVGNATTEAIARNAVVFCEPEWGLDITGAGKGSFYGNGGQGSGEGGLYVSF